jgi:hypothetical protein
MHQVKMPTAGRSGPAWTPDRLDTGQRSQATDRSERDRTQVRASTDLEAGGSSLGKQPREELAEDLMATRRQSVQARI